MNQDVIEALQYNNNLSDLKGFFDKKPYLDIEFNQESPQTIMMDSGYTYNLSTKFWRVLKTADLIESNKSDIPMSDYLLEVFTNQCLAFTDILATWINHFLSLGLSGGMLSTHNDKFIKKFKEALSDRSHDSSLDMHHLWSKTKLYPYRNIIHHMGALSSAVAMDMSYVAVPKESEWDFVQLREDLKEYPSQTAFQIMTGLIKIPNILTGDPGNSHKYESIVDFSKGWCDKLYEMASLFVEIVVAEKQNNI